MYFAVIGDIIDSKKLADRWLVQEHLQKVLETINMDYVDCIASKFTITLGDEFQGLLNSASELMKMIDHIRYSMYPVEIRFGIGVGSMSTEIIRERSIGSDGPAYWAAREAIEYIHENNDYGCSKVCIHLYQDQDQDEEENLIVQMINSSLRLCDRMEKGWTKSQFVFVRDLVMEYGYGNDGKYQQKRMAQEAGVTAQTINAKFKKTGITTYVEARRRVEQLMQREWGD